MSEFQAWTRSVAGRRRTWQCGSQSEGCPKLPEGRISWPELRIYRHMTGEGSSSEESAEEDGDRVTVSHQKPEEKDWVDLSQPEQIPNIREEDVTNYYLHGKNPVTGGSKNLRRYIEKARKFSLEPRYIDNMRICSTVSTDVTYIKTRVRPSMKKGLYNVHICLYKDTVMVSEAECECKVGAVGYCSHVGGVLFRLVRLKNPCTSSLCSWNVPSVSRPLEPQMISEINWWPGKANPANPWPFVYKAGPCEDAENFKEEVLDGLASVNPECVLYLHSRQSHADISPFIDTFAAPCSVDDDVNLTEEWVQDIFRDYMEDIEVPVSLSVLVERATRGQACNPLWKKARSLILTSSNFGLIAKRRSDTPPENLIKLLCGYKSVPKTFQMRYGLKYEARARKLYMKQHQQKCSRDNKSVTVRSVGLVVSPETPYLGSSLDGLVECPQCQMGGLEIKCPWKFRTHGVFSQYHIKIWTPS